MGMGLVSSVALTDGRFRCIKRSLYGSCFLGTVGGNMALVEEGDIISMGIDNNKLDFSF